MHPLSKSIITLTSLLALSLTAAPARAQSVVASVNASRAPADEFWLSASVGWFYTPTTSFLLQSVHTMFFATGGTDRNVIVELLTEPRFNGGVLLASGEFNTLLARGRFGGVTFATPIQLDASTRYFIGFRNMAPTGAGDFELERVSELLRANYTDVDGADFFSALRYDFENDGQYKLELDEGSNTQPILEFIRQDATTVVPEPSTVWLLVAGLTGLLAASRYRKRADTRNDLATSAIC